MTNEDELVTLVAYGLYSQALGGETAILQARAVVVDYRNEVLELARDNSSMTDEECRRLQQRFSNGLI